MLFNCLNFIYQWKERWKCFIPRLERLLSTIKTINLRIIDTVICHLVRSQAWSWLGVVILLLFLLQCHQIWAVQLPVRGHLRRDRPRLPLRPLLPHPRVRWRQEDLLGPKPPVHEQHPQRHRQPHPRRRRQRRKKALLFTLHWSGYISELDLYSRERDYNKLSPDSVLDDFILSLMATFDWTETISLIIS